MIFGDPDTFAIECHHDPVANESRRVYGRIRLWVAGLTLGNINELTCWLNPIGSCLESVLNALALDPDPDVDLLDDCDAFAFLDQKLYLDDERTSAQINDDARRFARFHFLTNSGESFDHTKSFVVRSGDRVRVLFRDDHDKFHAGDVNYDVFKWVVESFFHWIDSERERAA